MQGDSETGSTVNDYLAAVPESRGVNWDGRRVIRFGGPKYRALIWHPDKVELSEIAGRDHRVIDSATITAEVLRQLRALWRKAGRPPITKEPDQ